MYQIKNVLHKIFKIKTIIEKYSNIIILCLDVYKNSLHAIEIAICICLKFSLISVYTLYYISSYLLCLLTFSQRVNLIWRNIGENDLNKI